MLEQLDQVDWVLLDAQQVPDLLFRLNSEEEQDRQEAFEALAQKIAPSILLDLHGRHTDLLDLTRNNLPAITTPFILELLEVGDNTDKGGLLELLYDLASYVGIENWYLSGLPAEQRNNYRHWARSIYDAVNNGLAIYHSLLNADPKIRESAEDLLAILATYKEAK
ncbi:MAG: hypothetical protein U0528_07185 [Anaerolineae bacterium]